MAHLTCQAFAWVLSGQGLDTQNITTAITLLLPLSNSTWQQAKHLGYTVPCHFSTRTQFTVYT